MSILMFLLEHGVYRILHFVGVFLVFFFRLFA